MQRVRESLFHRQARRVLDDHRYALALTAILSVLPYMGWLALALIALVTLRKDWRLAGIMVLPAIIGNMLLSLKLAPISGAFFGALLNVIPCYFAAMVLRQTSSWRAVAIGLFALAVGGSCVLQMISPEFIVNQYMDLKTLIHNMGPGQVNLLDVWEAREVSPLKLANYLLGVQVASIAFSVMVPLLFARSVQSQLFYPGGFQQELLNFRGDKISLAVLVLLSAAAYSNWHLAMNSLPLVMFYFILAGLSLAACLLSRIRPLGVLVLLLVPTVLLAWVMLPLYVLLGAFDSLFNVRLYLSSKTGKVG